MEVMACDGVWWTCDGGDLDCVFTANRYYCMYPTVIVSHVSRFLDSPSLGRFYERGCYSNSGLKLDVEFDKNGEAVGTNADKYKSYIGVLSRTKMPIDIPCWRDVPVDIKEKIWDDVLTVFNIPMSKKKQVISIANKRGDLWIEGRLNKDGECLNAETKEAIERINLLKEQVSQGGFTPNGKDDVLTKALGTKEHYGRVRGVGGLVGHKQYFGKSSYRRGECLSMMDLDMITQMITEKVRADMHKEMEHYFQHRTIGSLENIGRIEKGFYVEKDVEVEVNGKSKDVEVEINCEGKDVEHDLFNEISIEGVECELAVLEKGKVALGKVFRAPNDDSRSHGRAFGLNELRVSIDVVFEGLEDIPLPLITEEFSTVGEAQGSFVRWPKNLISLQNSQVNVKTRANETSKNKVKKKKMESSKNVESSNNKRKESVNSNTRLKNILDKKYESRRLLSKMVTLMENGRSTNIVLNENVMGYEQTIFLTKDDITQVLDMEKLNISVIQTFLGCLHGICNTDVYGFICPHITSMVGQKFDQVTTYVSNWMAKERKPIYLVPYFHNNHWMLALVNIVDNNFVHWFDPLGHLEPSDFKNFINLCIRVYGFNGGKRKSSKARQWVHVKHFQDTTPYSKEDIDETVLASLRRRTPYLSSPRTEFYSGFGKVLNHWVDPVCIIQEACVFSSALILYGYVGKGGQVGVFAFGINLLGCFFEFSGGNESGTL
ncbi:hypothetical protein RND81_06G071900 [Saponaria officinalis]|uniref:DUF8039 domain-containing protein n=1 Tax=Saponaria officinalis TaxID=3572 RepID=A0AAW1K4J8_SAPOF